MSLTVPCSVICNVVNVCSVPCCNVLDLDKLNLLKHPPKQHSGSEIKIPALQAAALTLLHEIEWEEYFALIFTVI